MMFHLCQSLFIADRDTVSRKDNPEGNAYRARRIETECIVVVVVGTDKNSNPQIGVFLGTYCGGFRTLGFPRLRSPDVFW